MRSFVKKLPLVNKVVKLKDLFLGQINAILTRVEVIEQYQYAIVENQTSLLQAAIFNVESLKRLELAVERSETEIKRAHQDLVRRAQVLRELHERDKLTEPAIGPIDFVEPPVPVEINVYFVPVYKALRRLKAKGFNPSFVMDVGASNGDWSRMAKLLFPEARFILIEPLASRYSKEGVAQDPKFEVIEMAISNLPGSAPLNVAWDLISSSMFGLEQSQSFETVTVPVTTLDEVAKQKGIIGRGLLKIDIQYSEDRALAGASALLSQVDVVVLELAMKRDYPDSKVFLEMLQIMDKLGFRYADDAGEYRLAENGTLSHKDSVLVRHDLLI